MNISAPSLHWQSAQARRKPAVDMYSKESADKPGLGRVRGHLRLTSCRSLLLLPFIVRAWDRTSLLLLGFILYWLPVDGGNVRCASSTSMKLLVQAWRLLTLRVGAASRKMFALLTM